MKRLSLRSAANVCSSRFRCARTRSGGVNAIHWFSDTQAKCTPRLPRIGRAPLPLIVVCSSTILNGHVAGASGRQWPFHSLRARVAGARPGRCPPLPGGGGRSGGRHPPRPRHAAREEEEEGERGG